jgi:ketosteroid isomerase-like protein
MSPTNVEVVRRLFDLWGTAGADAALAGFEASAAPEFEFVPTMGGAIEGHVYRGPGAATAWYRDMLQAFEELRPQADEFVDLGEYVLVVGRTFMRGRHSGIGGDFPWVQRFKLHDHSIVSCRTYADIATALGRIAPNLARLLPMVKHGRPDLDKLVSILDAAVVWDVSRSSFPDAGVYQGIEGVREWVRGLDDAFEEMHYETVAAREQGDRIAVLTRVRGHGASTKIDIEYSFAQVWTFRNRKLIRMDRYDSWNEALTAARVAQ